MRSIMVLNPKGGCGKSTIATNIASFYASKGKSVMIADFDPQGSSIDWLAARPDNVPEIEGIAAWKDGFKAPRNKDVLVMDVPAGVHGKDLTALIRRAQSVIIPVLPSPIDMRAAAKFVHEIHHVGKVEKNQVKLAVVANRVKENTLVFHMLEKFLKKLDIPFIGKLRDTQNYIRAAERGLGVFELAPSSVYQDMEQWASITRWLNSKRSMP